MISSNVANYLSETDNQVMMIDILMTILLILAITDVVTILVIAIIERNDTDKFLAWSVIVIILPFIGALGYFIIGQRLSLYRQYSRKRMKEVSAEGFFKADTGIASLDSVKGISTSYRNSVLLFTDGKDLFSKIKEDLDSAERSILMEYYIMINDNLGNSIIDSLCRKAQDGLDVMLIGDGFGFRKLDDDCFKKMESSGVRFTYINRPSFHSLNPRTNNCDHRKIIVIDDHITYCSGLNVTDDYVGSGHLGNWRDSAVRIEGDISEHAGRRFMMTWAYAANTDIPQIQEWNIGFDGDEKVSLVYGGPDLRPNPIMEQYKQMIRSARKQLLIETPYFNNVELVREVKRAADSGVDVRIIIPGRPDHWFTFWNNYHAAKRAVGSGVKFYLYGEGFLHSKILAVDGTLSSVGSANFDDRTAYFNFDANMMFHSEKVTEDIVSIFNDDLGKCRPFNPEEYGGLVAFIKVCICGIVRPLS